MYVAPFKDGFLFTTLNGSFNFNREVQTFASGDERCCRDGTALYP